MLKNALHHLKKPLNVIDIDIEGAADVVHDEYQYLHLINDILKEGSYEEGRNGRVKTVFGAAMHFSLLNGCMPILTTKAMAWKTCFKELMWFIKGETSNTTLQAQGVKIWNGNATRAFLDAQGLTNNAENDLGPVYGHQWRHFNAPYVNCETPYDGQGVDQLAYIIAQLKNPATRSSRRLILSAWNPVQIPEMALPPCHLLAQFHVTENTFLSCSLYQRSGDVGLGVPFNISSYCFLTHLMAQHCGLIAKEFVHYLGNCHIYAEHEEKLREQLLRNPFPFPRIQFLQKHSNIETYTLSDLEILDYEKHPAIVMDMVA
jgi:thymidylate synthase